MRYLRVLDNPEQIVSTGLNRAIREAKGEVILRMDAHTLYAPDYIRSCVEVLHETNADNVGGPALTRAHGYLAQAIAHAFHAPFVSGGAKFHNPKYEGSVDTVTYGCWRKSTLERIGVFDEKLVRGQDDELNVRLVSRGGIVWQSPRIISWYRSRSNLTELFWQYFQYGFWKVAGDSQATSGHKLAKYCARFVIAGGDRLAALCGGRKLCGSLLKRFLAVVIFVGMYFMASIASAFLVAKKKGWLFLPTLPVVFATYHLSYALGFVLALLYRPVTWDRPNPMRRILTAITR